jgi:CBS domain-containing protein
MTERPRSVAPDAALRDAALDMVRAGVAGCRSSTRRSGDRDALAARAAALHRRNSYLHRGGGQAAGPSGGDGRPEGGARRHDPLGALRSPEQPVAEVPRHDDNKDVDRVPVVREGRLVGFLTRGTSSAKLIGS